MKLVQMKCPNCDANLEVDDGLDSFFCKYCGTKIVLEGQSEASLKAKTAVKAMNKIGEMYDKNQERKAKERAAANKRFPLVIGLFILLIVLGMFLLTAPVRKEDKRIETVYAEIQADISAGDYDAALAKLPGLRYDTGVSRESAKKWDAIREDLTELINTANDG